MWIVVSAALLLTSCATDGDRAEEDQSYVVQGTLDVTHLLAPPPADPTRDLAVVRAAQQTRTAEQAALAEADIPVDVFLFRSVLGPRFDPEKLPRTAEFFARVYRTARPYLTLTKDCWSRPRPFVLDPTLIPLQKALASTYVRTPASHPAVIRPPDSPCTPVTGSNGVSPSYPSGHAAVGTMMAILLTEMVPEHRTDLFARGWAYGEARVISGVHYPSDVEAGRILGTLLVSQMYQGARFREDLMAARAELREALGYR